MLSSTVLGRKRKVLNPICKMKINDIVLFITGSPKMVVIGISGKNISTIRYEPYIGKIVKETFPSDLLIPFIENGNEK